MYSTVYTVYDVSVEKAYCTVSVQYTVLTVKVEYPVMQTKTSKMVS